MNKEKIELIKLIGRSLRIISFRLNDVANDLKELSKSIEDVVDDLQEPSKPIEEDPIGEE